MFKDITWATVALALGPALLAAISALAATWITNHFQIKIKKFELDSQSKFKARELFFNAYQQKLERARTEAQKASDFILRSIAEIMAAESETEKEKILNEHLTIFRALNVVIRDNIDMMESELKEAGLFEQTKKDIAFIRDNFAIDPQKLTTKSLEELTFKLSKAQDIETRLLLALLNKKSENLFKEYLKD